MKIRVYSLTKSCSPTYNTYYTFTWYVLTSIAYYIFHEIFLCMKKQYKKIFFDIHNPNKPRKFNWSGICQVTTSSLRPQPLKNKNPCNIDNVHLPTSSQIINFLLRHGHHLRHHLHPLNFTFPP